MDGEINELDELTREIRKIISDNEKFLARIMDDDFEAEDDDDKDEETALVEL